MISPKEKEALWRRVSKEFPSDSMLRDLHFIRELMDVIERTSTGQRTLKEIGILARNEFAEWLRLHPELQANTGQGRH